MFLTPAQRAIRACILADIPVFLWGPPGCGKTQFAHDIAPSLGMVSVDFRALLRDSVDLRGIPAADMERGATVWLRPSELPFVGNDGPEDVLLVMDELNAAAPSMQAACFGLVQERRAGEHKLKPGVRIVAAGNRQSDRAAAQRVPSALLNRFAHIDFLPDAKSWQAWARQNGIADMVRAFLSFRPGLLHRMPGEKDEMSRVEIPADARAFPTNRAWANLSSAMAHCADDAELFLVAAALVGDGPAHEFIAFRGVYGRLPRVADIVRDPAGAIVPDASDIGALYAVTTALARAADRANVGAILQYGQRLPREFESLLATEMTARDSDLKATAAYTQWALRNQDIALGVAA